MARLLLAWAMLLVPVLAGATSVSPAARTLLSSGRPLVVVVEVDGRAVDESAAAERDRRRLRHDDDAILALRSRGYAAVKSAQALATRGPDAVPLLDFSHFPLTVWRLSSPAALARLEAHPAVKVVHENLILHAVSVSDLGFINQPQAAAIGAAGTGTTIAVIDGGLGTNYTQYADFGPCTAVAAPPGTCRVSFNQDFYPGLSTETAHGTNVAAIALGVAPGAKLAMFDVFNGSGASSVDVLSAMNTAISDRALYNIVAISMSLGDGSSNATACTASLFGTAVANAANAGIMTVAAAGNSGSKTGLGNPACAPGVVSVGAVYDAAYGTTGWVAPADSGGVCYDASAADHVTCFSQSAGYLSLLAPGTFVNAPNASFQQSGTSQATPHVAGAIAVLRARYPAESLGETLQRLQLSDIRDTDPANGVATPRLNVLAAVNQGTALSLTGTGPTQATAGGTATYTLKVANGGPLAATNVTVTDLLPAGASLLAIPAGCTLVSGALTCVVGSLATGASATLTLNVRWTVTGPVSDTVSVAADQVNSAPAGQQTLAFGTPPGNDSDGPLPGWAYGVSALAMMGIGRRRLGGPLSAVGVRGRRKARERVANPLRREHVEQTIDVDCRSGQPQG